MRTPSTPQQTMRDSHSTGLFVSLTAAGVAALAGPWWRLWGGGHQAHLESLPSFRLLSRPFRDRCPFIHLREAPEWAHLGWFMRPSTGPGPLGDTLTMSPRGPAPSLSPPPHTHAPRTSHHTISNCLCVYGPSWPIS